MPWPLTIYGMPGGILCGVGVRLEKGYARLRLGEEAGSICFSFRQSDGGGMMELTYIRRTWRSSSCLKHSLMMSSGRTVL